MKKEAPTYTDIFLPDGSLHHFPPESLPPGSLPTSPESINRWHSAVAEILEQDHLPREIRWSHIKPYYYGGISVLINKHSEKLIDQLSKWKESKPSGYPLSKPEAWYAHEISTFGDVCLLTSYKLLRKLTDSLSKDQGQTVYNALEVVHRTLIRENQEKSDPVGLHIQSGMGTAIEHLTVVCQQAPFLWKTAYGVLPTSSELRTLLDNTMTHHIHPLSRTHIASLIPHEQENRVERVRPQEATLKLIESPRGAYLCFATSPARMNSFTHKALSIGHRTPDAPRLGCPARLTHQGINPIKQLTQLFIEHTLETYDHTFLSQTNQKDSYRDL